MSSRVLVTFRRHMIQVPRVLWERQLRARARRAAAQLGFMSEEHHLVRDFAVRELPGIGEPLTPEVIAGRLSLAVARVESILDDLEKHMTFVCRNTQGAVAWAYPVTIENTPHHVTFSTGEQLYSA